MVFVKSKMVHTYLANHYNVIVVKMDPLNTSLTNILHSKVSSLNWMTHSRTDVRCLQWNYVIEENVLFLHRSSVRNVGIKIYMSMHFFFPVRPIHSEEQKLKYITDSHLYVPTKSYRYEKLSNFNKFYIMMME